MNLLESLFEGYPVSLSHSPEKGRYFVCNKDVEPGEALFEHDPAYATAIDTIYKNGVCNTCLSFIKETNRHNMIRCGGCDEIFFCSYECKASRRMDTYHTQMECSILSNFTPHRRAGLSNNDILGIKLLVRILCREFLENNDEQAGILASLEDHSTEYSEEVRRDLSKLVDTIIAIEEPVGVFSENPGRVFSLAGKIKSNVFGIWCRNGSEPVWCGAALYLKCSFFNHSCFPNCTVIQDSNTKLYGQLHPCGAAFTIRSLCAIPKGTELCISYISLDDNTEVRKKTLQTNWLFTCACERCKDPHSDEKSIASFCCRTPKCTGGLLIPSADVEIEDDDASAERKNGEDKMVGVCRVCFASDYIPLARDIFTVS